jgi:hypothetical protein
VVEPRQVERRLHPSFYLSFPPPAGRDKTWKTIPFTATLFSKADRSVPITNTHVSKEAKMKILTIIFLVALSGLANAASENDFKAETTEQLINLCTATPEDPLYQQAVNFCHGYLVGAYHYHQAAFASGSGTRLVCFPDPPPSRNDAIEMFLEWAEAHPQYMQDRPVDTEFRFLEEKFPCNP